MGARELGIVLCALLVATAGCIGGDDGGDEIENTATDSTQDSTEETSSNTTDQPASTTNETGPVVETEPMSYEGALGPGASVANRGFHASGDSRYHLFDLEGTITDVQLEMTWSATNPTMESLAFAVGPREDLDNGGWSAEDYERVTGTSPLNITLSNPQWDKGKYVLWAWWDTETSAAANAMEQSFTVEGAIQHQLASSE